MGEFEGSCSFSSLLCHETEEEACCFETELEDDDESLYLDAKDDEYIESLVRRETYTSASDCPITDRDNWLLCARLNAIEWIFNTRTHFGFQVHTAYLSVIYLDRFLSKKSIDDGKLWAVRLLSVACLSIAAKMEERRVPVLSEFPTQVYHFENKTIQRMELLVLSTLEWKLSSVTPFVYLSYFIHKFYGESVRPKGLISKALQYIVVIIKEINLVEHRSSVVAAAAVLAASCDERLTRKAMKLKTDFISFWGASESEHVFFCYNMIQEIEMRKSKTPKSVISSNYSSFSHATEKSSAVSIGVGTKRKLSFKEPDQ